MPNLIGTAPNQVPTNGALGNMAFQNKEAVKTDLLATTALTIGDATAGSVLFAGTSGVVSQDNANLFWDDTNNRLGIGTSSPTAKLDVNADTVRVRTAKTPASATDAGNAGDICWDSNYVYVCIATNTWKRSALSTW